MSDYTNWKYNPAEIKARLRSTLKQLVLLKDNGVDYDAVIVRGTSGIWLAPLLIQKGYNTLLVRKDGEGSHNPVPVEGNLNGVQSVVFIDDFVGTGTTLNHVITKAADKFIKVIGLVCHDPEWDIQPSNIPKAISYMDGRELTKGSKS